MKIAIPTKENNQNDDHFGHCAFYSIFSISDNNEIMEITIAESPKGCGCKAS
jgi:predicted Fe-Mo cluster-binding NifX family protein